MNYILRWKDDNTYWAGKLHKNSAIHKWGDREDAKLLDMTQAFAIVASYALWKDCVDIIPV
jgi:hypothetical protein